MAKTLTSPDVYKDTNESYQEWLEVNDLEHSESNFIKFTSMGVDVLIKKGKLYRDPDGGLHIRGNN